MKKIVFAIIAVFVTGLLTGCGTTSITRSTVRERPDSLLVRHEPANVEAHSDSLIQVAATIADVDTAKKADTICQDKISQPSQSQPKAVRSLRAKIDTTVNGIKINAEYRWPEDQWKIIVSISDTMVRWMVRDSLIERPYPVEKIPLWIYLVLGCMAIALIAVVVKR